MKHITYQPAWIRVTHWINALSVAMMVTSGWQVYNASPIFPALQFPSYMTLGGWLGGALQWHFAIMWLFVINFSLYTVMLLVSRRLFNKLLPINIKSLVTDIRNSLRGKLKHKDLSQYNSIQKIAYIIVIVDIIILIISGLAIWKSVQLPLLRTLMGGYDNARVVHFIAMTVMVSFFVVHIIMVITVPRTLLLMIRGR